MTSRILKSFAFYTCSSSFGIGEQTCIVYSSVLLKVKFILNLVL